MIAKYTGQKNIPVMSREQVRNFDAWAIETLKIPSTVLMENAGRNCARVIIDHLAADTTKTIAVICGKGNNGGDGFVVARHLINAGFHLKIALCGQIAQLKGDPAINANILRNLGIDIAQLDLGKPLPEQLAPITDDADLVVDAIFGTGLQGQVRNDYGLLIDLLNAQNKPIAAVDIPSGLDCDTANPLGISIKAALTVTFAALKKGFTTPNAQRYTGQIFIASIGIDSRLWDQS